jgi:hypothetical protein
MGQKWEGWNHKIRLVREQLDNLSDDELIVVSDCYDVVFQKGSKAVVNAFLSYRKPVVISAEMGIGYSDISNEILPKTPNSLYRSLNGGFWMARVGNARNMIDEMWEGGEDDDDDQRMFYKWHAENQTKATIDYKNVLVTSSNYNYVDEDLGYRDHLVYNKHTFSVPCAIHLSACTDMTKIYEVLELSPQIPMVLGERAHRRYQTYELAAKNPWPDVRPSVEPDGEHFLRDTAARFFSKLLERPMSVILELGSWVGAGSTKFFLEHSNALVIANDTWRGDSLELVKRREHKIPILYETFCHNLWYYRDRIIPLRMDTLNGLWIVAEHAIVPDLIYVDANHSYESVFAQLNLIYRLFPNSIVCGDDYASWPEVGRAVRDFTSREGIEFIIDGEIWMLKEHRR